MRGVSTSVIRTVTPGHIPVGHHQHMTSGENQGQFHWRFSAAGLLLGVALGTLTGVAVAKCTRQDYAHAWGSHNADAMRFQHTGEGATLAGSGPRSAACSETVPSPGAWQPLPGTRPAWNWIPPEHGLLPRMDRFPWWVRLWYRTPVLDRFAYAWMWDHGGWDVVPHGAPEL